MLELESMRAAVFPSPIRSDIFSLLFLSEGEGGSGGGGKGGGGAAEAGRSVRNGGQGATLLAAGHRDGSVCFLDTRVAGGWVNGGGGRLGGSRGGGVGGMGIGQRAPSDQIKCASCVCGMLALEGGCWYPDVVTNVMGGGGGGGRCDTGALLRWDLRRMQQPVVKYHGHVNSHHRAIPAVSGGGAVVWCGGSDGVVRGWDSSSGKLLLHTEQLCESQPPHVVAAWQTATHAHPQKHSPCRNGDGSNGVAVGVTPPTPPGVRGGWGRGIGGYAGGGWAGVMEISAPLWISTEKAPLSRLQVL